MRGDLISENAKLCGVLSIDYGSDLVKLRQMVLDRLNSQGYDLSLTDFTSTIEPLEKLFAIVDHSRALAFMFGDGIVPSNVKAGYLARMVLRRTILLCKDINVPNILPEMVQHHIDIFSKSYPDIKQNESRIIDMVNLEIERFSQTLERGRRAVKRALDSGGINQDKLLELYDSQGLPPSVVSEFSEEQGKSVEVPDGFLAMVADRHVGETKVKIESERIETALKKLKVEEDLYNFNDLSKSSILTLAESNIKSLNDLAELDSEELFNLLGDKIFVNEDDAGSVIMKARQHWFAEEKVAD